MSSRSTTELRRITKPSTTSPCQSGQAGEEMNKTANTCTLGFLLKKNLETLCKKKKKKKKKALFVKHGLLLIGIFRVKSSPLLYKSNNAQ